MTSRKTKADDEGHKRGALGKFDPPNKLTPSDAWGDRSDIGTSPKGHGKFTSDDVSFLTGKASDTPHGNDQLKAREIWQEVEDQSPDDSNRAIKSRGGFA